MFGRSRRSIRFTTLFIIGFAAGPLIFIALAHGDEFGRLVGPPLFDVPRRADARGQTSLTVRALEALPEVLRGERAALVIVSTDQGNMAKLLLSSGMRRRQDGAGNGDLVPVMIVDRFETIDGGDRTSFKARGRDLMLFEGFQVNLDTGQVVPDGFGGDIRLSAGGADGPELTAVGKNKLYAFEKPLPIAPTAPGRPSSGRTVLPTDFNGRYHLIANGQISGDLELSVAEDATVAGRFRSDRNGAAYPVTGKVAADLARKIEFTIQFPRSTQMYEGLLWTEEKNAFAGTVQILDHPYSFFAVREGTSLPIGSIGPAVSTQWVAQSSPTKERLRGLSVASPRIIWTSGNHGTVLRTTDGGSSWVAKGFAGAEDLDFRDVHAVDEHKAYLLSIGEGEKSRIYKTVNGGSSWTSQMTLRDPKGFLDAIAFWDADHGIAMGDPIDGRFLILTTDDGGTHWTRSPAEGMPPALDKEGAFAASGTCLVVEGKKNVWFGTGGAHVSRVFRSTDGGRSWTAYPTPIPAGIASSGIFSVAFRDSDNGVAVGGDYEQPDGAIQVVALTTDGGRTWKTPSGRGPRGYRSGVIYLANPTKPTLVAVGPSGSDASSDDGETWFALSDAGAHAVGAVEPDAGWAVGENGSIASFRITTTLSRSP